MMPTKITAILIDDENKSREVLRNLLTNFFPEIELLGEAENVEKAYHLAEQKKPKLVFLDIQMPRGSGFTLLKKYNEIPFEVIFVTSYDQYAINAIKFSALDYLLKPVEVSDLRKGIEKAKKRIESKEKSSIQLINLVNNLDSEIKEKKVVIHTGEKVELINSSEIIYIEADGSYCTVVSKNRNKHTTAKFLKDFEDYFGEDSDFVRIHKSCLINTRHIKNYSKGEPCFIEMADGNSFEVSRRKKQDVLGKLKK